MKKVVAIVAVLLMSVFSAAAVENFYNTDSKIVPGVVNLDYTDTKYVDFCVEKVYQDNTREAYPGINVYLTPGSVCLDKNGVYGCQAGDEFAPSVFAVSVVAPAVTDAQGCADVKLETFNAQGGLFYYKLNGKVMEAQVTEEQGTAYVPEFTAIGAGMVLVGAGIIAAKRRKE